MRPRRVLVFPAGTEIGLEIHQALQHCKEVEIYGAGQAVSNHAPFVYERYRELPSIYEESWLTALVELCLFWNIDYIFPAYDDVIVALARHQADLPAVVLTASEEVCLITRSKSQTYQSLKSLVRVPETYDTTSEADFPLFVKPDRGQGSQGAQKVLNAVELSHAIASINEPIVCEYLSGEEYTIDCFSDRQMGVLFCGARVRLRVRNGIAVHTRSVSLEGAEVIAAKIHAALGMRGAWFFQLKRSKKGELTLLEVAPRISGSMSTHRVQGINFPLLTIFEHERLPLTLIVNPMPVELDRALKSQYKMIGFNYEALYIDLDDTLLVSGHVNLDAMQLIFKCINKKIPVILITRHQSDLKSTLAEHRLTGLFDEIIHLDKSQFKSDYVQRKNAIFVDDSFAERQDVRQRCGIPTFDCSMIDALISTLPNNT